MIPESPSSSGNPVRICVPSDAAGLRLDSFLRSHFSTTGLRTWRRLCVEVRVLLDQHPAKPSAKLRAGQEILLLPPKNLQKTIPDAEKPHIITVQNNLAALYKPARMHTAMLHGSSAISLESYLPELFPDRHPPLLLNRLDYATSGLVLAAYNPEGAHIWHQMEDAGKIEKRYLALVIGNPPEHLVLRSALDTEKRHKTRILPKDAAILRHTETFALARFSAGLFVGSDQPLTLLACRIRKGARHQIRAHLASAGFPLWGDELYGGGKGFFLLHHGACQFPEFLAVCPAPWQHLLPADAEKQCTIWLARDHHALPQQGGAEIHGEGDFLHHSG